MRQRITRALHAAAEFAENMAGGDGDGEEEAAATPADEPDEPAAFTIPEVPTHGMVNGTNFVQMPGTGSFILEGPLPPQLEELIARRAAEQEQEAAAVSDLLEEEEEEETAADTDLGAVDGMPGGRCILEMSLFEMCMVLETTPVSEVASRSHAGEGRPF